MCPEGWCIPAEWRCNGLADCAKGEDEQNCSCSDADQFRCSYGGGCVEKRSVCDGVPNCADGSDEFDCVSIKDDILLISVPGVLHKLPVCSNNFTSEHANVVCRQLGYNKYSWLDQIQLNNDSLTNIFVSKFQILPPIGIEKIQFAVKTNAMNECSTGTIVTLGCEVHSCSSDLFGRSRQKRIVGGKSSEPGEFTSVGVLIHPVKKWACTATMIAPFWLITSALCVKRTDPSITEWKFIPGNNDPTEIGSRIQTKNVRKFVSHPSYKFRTVTADYDVMLVQMEESLISIENTLELPDLARNVSLACLGVDSTVIEEECVTVGYGYTSPGGYFINKRKNRLKVNVVSRSICNSSDNYGKFLTDRMICAENDEPGKEVCSNDEGAPLLCRNLGSSHVPDRWLLKGVLTAHSCGSHAKHPGLYADVFSTHRWIFDIIGQGMTNQENLV
uniref:Peptidase S1 domain-containing protein n=1 Tax=Romanomermis culicivorax TaxID=13658 RepID=A0A915K5E6_ROMCU